jgi:hypothetical protein
MNGKLIKDAVGIVTQAIQEDHDQQYAKAYDLYKKALEYFMVGLKCMYYYFLELSFSSLPLHVFVITRHMYI